MSMKDLKSKGKTWLGGVHKKLGAILYDAGVANKDTTNHVEGQSKNVNEPNTNVAQESLSCQGDPVNHKDKKMPNIGSYVGGFIVTEDFYVDSGFTDSPLQPKPADQKVESDEGVLRNGKLGVNIEEDKSSVSDGELIFHSEKGSVQSSLSSDDSGESSDYGKKLVSHSKARMISSYFTENLDCPTAASSFATYSELDLEKQIAEAGLVSCSSSLLTESENLAMNEESCDDPVRFDASSCSKNDDEAVDFVSSSSLALSESVEESTPRINKVGLWTGSSGNGHVWFRDHAQSGSVVSSLGSGLLEDSSDIITDPDMETIDLLDEVKAEESCADISNRELYAASHRAQKLRSYKQKMQDAFYSKKRLAREYELLSVWFGDANIEDMSPTFIPSITTASTSSDPRILQTDHIPESDWELL